LSPEDFRALPGSQRATSFSIARTPIELVGKVGIFALVGDFAFSHPISFAWWRNEENDPRFLNYYLNSF